MLDVIFIEFFKNTRCKAILFSFLLFVPLEKLQSQSFDKIGFMGYFRSGFGLDSKGKSMSAFQAPNAESKYRLGNEAETYLETGFNYLIKDESGAIFDTRFLFAMVTPMNLQELFH